MFAIKLDFFLTDVVNSWWPWFNVSSDTFYLQFFILLTYVNIYTNPNIFYTLLYVFVNFALVGLNLAVFQAELFTAFLWFVECSVILVFLLLLFYLNVKGIHEYNHNNLYIIFLPLLIFLFWLTTAPSVCIDTVILKDLSLVGYVDDYYEAFNNPITNDLIGFYISYYMLNSIEYILIGFLLLTGSVLCVNLHKLNKNTRVQGLLNFLTVFKFFEDFVNFLFLRKQNTTKQGNTKATVKAFYKK